VDRFLMLTPFARDFFAEHTSIPREKMRIKPNAALDPGMGRGAGGYALFVGRLAPEKGIDVLLAAARSGLGIPLKIAGQGPLAERVREAHAAGYVEYFGPRNSEQLRGLMQNAACLLVPSLWYEGLPMVIPEAFGAGLPVVASEIGSLATLVEHEQTGLLVRAGDAGKLAAACRRLAADRPLLTRMRSLARTRYMLSYQPAHNFDLLMSIYRELVPDLTTVGLSALAAPVLHPGLPSHGFLDRPLVPARGTPGSGY
jgi:glycosyltransferase involved in cell wall biosynthesis